MIDWELVILIATQGKDYRDKMLNALTDRGAKIFSDGEQNEFYELLRLVKDAEKENYES